MRASRPNDPPFVKERPFRMKKKPHRRSGPSFFAVFHPAHPEAEAQPTRGRSAFFQSLPRSKPIKWQEASMARTHTALCCVDQPIHQCMTAAPPRSRGGARSRARPASPAAAIRQQNPRVTQVETAVTPLLHTPEFSTARTHCYVLHHATGANCGTTGGGGGGRKYRCSPRKPSRLLLKTRFIRPF